MFILFVLEFGIIRNENTTKKAHRGKFRPGDASGKQPFANAGPGDEGLTPRSRRSPEEVIATHSTVLA